MSTHLADVEYVCLKGQTIADEQGLSSESVITCSSSDPAQGNDSF